MTITDKQIQHLNKMNRAAQDIGLGTVIKDNSDRISDLGINIKSYGAIGDGFHDDTSSIQAALNASKHVYIPVGNFVVSSTLTPQSGATIQGAGIFRSVLSVNNINGPVIYSPSEQSTLDGFSIIGNDSAGSIGIQIDNTHRPYMAAWGELRFRHIRIGISADVNTGGSYFNSFKNIRFENCVDFGLCINNSAGSQSFGANSFETIFCTSCGVGVYLGRTGSNRMSLYAENNSSYGLQMVNARNNVVIGGTFENNNQNNGGISVLIDDDSKGQGNIIFSSFDVITDFVNYSSSSVTGSDLFHDSIGNRFRLASEWKVDKLVFDSALSGSLVDPNASGLCFNPYTFATSSAIPDARGFNVLRLEYDSPIEITGINGNHGQILIVMAINTNAYINNGGEFYLNGNWIPAAARDNLLLYCYNQGDTREWIELSRKITS